MNCPGGGLPGGSGLGGAIYLATGTATVVNCTATANATYNAAFSGGAAAGGIYNSVGTVSLKNTLIASNSAGSYDPDVSGSFSSQGYNLVGSATGSTGWLSLDLVGSDSARLDAKLGPLQNNGGPTPTVALLAGSPAIDHGASGGLTADQRDRPRLVDNPSVPNSAGGDGSDIGAFELQLPLTLEAAAKSGDDLIIRFFAETGTTNRLEKTDALNSGSWTTVTNIVGAGATVQVIDLGAASQPQRFYRGLTLP